MLLRISETDWTKLEVGLGSRTDVETAAILLASPVANGLDPMLAVRQVELVPDAGYKVRRIDQLAIEPVTLNRMVRRARDEGLAIFTAHSHPLAEPACFSRADDAGDARLLPSFAVQVPKQPHGSIVVAGSGDVLARALSNDGLQPLNLRIVGRKLRTLPTAREEVDDGHFHRQRLALGRDGQAMLRSMKIAIVGLGGTGSVVLVQLAHLGVGELLLIDGDRVEASNLSRR